MKLEERRGVAPRTRTRTKGASELAAVLLSWCVVACGGGHAKAKPKVVDPWSETSSMDDAPKTDQEDAGAPASSSNDAPPDAAPPTVQGNEESAQALLKQFVSPNADHSALTRSLRPTSADYKTLFDAEAAAKIEAAQVKDWDSGKAIIKPKPNQTEIKLWGATAADLAAGNGSAKEFPGGYKKIAKHLGVGVTFYRFKFVEPGKDAGTAYDGLAFVNGHWVIAPQPWKAMEVGKAADKDDADDGGGAGDDPPPKPKPKGKPKGKPKSKPKKK